MARPRTLVALASLSVMDDKLYFAVDLYQGTAEYYDRYRLAYPEVMIEDLIARAEVSGQGRLLDLACGTGQLAFPLRRSFAEVGRGPGTRLRADGPGQGRQAGARGKVRRVTADAETLDAEPGYFEPAVIGSAFHRLDRELGCRQAAAMATTPTGRVAVCWAEGPAAAVRLRRPGAAACLRGAARPVADRPRRDRPGSPSTGPIRNGDRRMPRCCPRPGSRRPGATSSASSTSGLWRNWPAGSGPPPSSRLRCLATRGSLRQRPRCAAAIGLFAVAAMAPPRHDVGFVYDLARKPTGALAVRGWRVRSHRGPLLTHRRQPARAGPEAASEPAVRKLRAIQRPVSGSDASLACRPLAPAGATEAAKVA